MRTDIKGLEGKYAITRDGRVWSYPKGGGSKNGMWMKQTLHVTGYYNFKMERKVQKIHRIIAQTYIPNPENKPEVNHKNGIKTDNRIENLEWCTAKENTQHAIKTGLRKPSFGEKSGLSKLTEKKVKEVRKLYATGLYSHRQLAERIKVSKSNIGIIILRHTWKHIA